MSGNRPTASPEAVVMRTYTSDFVAWLHARSRLPLDYSVASLRIVDAVVDGLRRGQPQRAQVAGTLLGLGAYTGEVIVRRAGGTWVDFDASQRELFRQAVGVRMPDGRVWNPLGRVVNRFEVGAEESVERFYLLLHGRSPAERAVCRERVRGSCDVSVPPGAEGRGVGTARPCH